MKEQIKPPTAGLFKAPVIHPALPVPQPGRVFRPTSFSGGSQLEAAAYRVAHKTWLDCRTCGTGFMTPQLFNDARRLVSASGKRDASVNRLLTVSLP